MTLNVPSRTGRHREAAVLVLEDGRRFVGSSYGAVGETVGEAVFSTGMTGYQETITDPSYHRQVVVMTTPHVGNTGVNGEDDESARIWVAGYVVREPALRSSSWRATRELEDELVEQGVVGVCEVDTRALTRHLRERGAMRVGLFSGAAAERPAAELLETVRSSAPMSGAALAAEVSTKQAYAVPAVGDARFTVAAVDLGIKAMTPTLLAQRGIDVHVLPATATIDDVLAVGVRARRGLLLQRPRRPGHGRARGGAAARRARPADPVLRHLLRQPAPRARSRLRHLQADLRPPRHQPACHGPHDRQGRGHRAQPRLRRRRAPRRDSETAYGRVRVSHVCLNDDVVEGLECLDLPAYSVQYHPEAAAGPHDAAYLFDRFVELMTTRQTDHQSQGVSA